jgi:hypothetical protein
MDDTLVPGRCSHGRPFGVMHWNLLARILGVENLRIGMKDSREGGMNAVQFETRYNMSIII